VRSVTTAVIGAGPYGLSVGAHLKAAGVDTQVFGKPMEFWEQMPAGMCLKSPWSASSLRDPAGAYSLNRYVMTASANQAEPIRLPFYQRYGHWFAQQAAPGVDPTYVRSIMRDREGFRLLLADGRTIRAGRVIVAIGISGFAHIPEFAQSLSPDLYSHTQAQTDPDVFRGRRVAVIGSGQSGLEWAALLHEAGASVEVIARRPVHWVSRRLYHTGPAKRLFYPPTDVGPPGINWVVAFPGLTRRLPDKVRSAMHRRSTQPAGATWLRDRVEGKVTITRLRSILRVSAHGSEVRLELDDGTSRRVDYLLLGTGYRPDITKIAFLDPELRQTIRQRNGFPVLNGWFESSVPGLHFAGGVAGYSFGPLCNFVAGAGVAARQVTRYAARRR
jgi:cation diffusion facilitator CzcD-associated flavoprotein CzcO